MYVFTRSVEPLSTTPALYTPCNNNTKQRGKNMKGEKGNVTVTTYPATITFEPVQEAIDESTKIPDAIKKLAKEVVRDNLDAINEIIGAGASKLEEIVPRLKDLEVPDLLAEHWSDIVNLLIKIAQALGIL